MHGERFNLHPKRYGYLSAVLIINYRNMALGTFGLVTPTEKANA